MKKFFIILYLCFGVIIFSVRTYAQTAYTPYVYSTPVYQRIYDQTYLTNMAVNQMMRSSIARSNATTNAVDRAALLAKWKKLYAQTSGPTQFKPTKQILITDEEILKMFNGDKEKAAEFDKTANQAVNDYSKKVLFSGAPTHDVASGLGYSSSLLYKIAHNYLQRENPDSYVVDNFLNLVNQIRTALIAEGKVAKLNAFDKERMLVINISIAAMIHKKYQDAVNQGDARAIKDAQMLSRKMIEDLVGVSFEKIVINKDGLTVIK